MHVIVGKVLQGSKLPRYFPRDRECGGLAKNLPEGVPWTAKAYCAVNYSMPTRRDPIELEIFKNIFHSIAEEMGAALRRTAFSPNIKERRDYSCAVFDPDGQVIAMGDHMPVHLGSMPMSVTAAISSCDLGPGDMVMLNDPFRGGTHLPDITLVAPVYIKSRSPRPNLLRCFAGASCRCRRDFSGIDGFVPRDLSGGIPYSARHHSASRQDEPRCTGATAE